MSFAGFEPSLAPLALRDTRWTQSIVTPRHRVILVSRAASTLLVASPAYACFWLSDAGLSLCSQVARGNVDRHFGWSQPGIRVHPAGRKNCADRPRWYRPAAGHVTLVGSLARSAVSLPSTL